MELVSSSDDKTCIHRATVGIRLPHIISNKPLAWLFVCNIYLTFLSRFVSPH